MRAPRAAGTDGQRAGGPVDALGRLTCSKLEPPATRRGTIARAHLFDRLREGRGRRLTLVCAPAGYGKTTLLVGWCEADRDRTPFAWLTADEGDSDPVRFWNHLIAALRAVHPPVGAGSLEALRLGPAAVAGIALPQLVEELADAPPSVLVVDDWHRVQSAVCDEAVRLLIEQVPPDVQIVLASRSDPRLPVGRWRAHGDLNELRGADLRLTHVEAASVLHQGNADLAPADVGRLITRTEGWATGLRLASILLQREEDPHAFVDDFAGDSRHLLEYFSDDVLTTVGEEMRGFMLRASILEEMSGGACDAVLETRGSAAMLAEIERRNLFLVAVDRHGERYRFHQLFVDVLRYELARTDPGEVDRLHLRAAAWFEKQGDAESAVGHMIAARDVAGASRLVTSLQRSLVNEGRLTTLARWLGDLSWPEAVADPQLAVMRASLAAQTSQPAEEVERWLAVASRRPGDGPLANGAACVESGVTVLRSLYLTRGVAPAVAAARRALELEPPESPWRRQALLGLGQALYLQGRADGARAPLLAARRLPYAHDHAPAAAAVLAYLALVELDGGELASARRYVGESFELLDAHGLAGTFVATNTHIAQAGIDAAAADPQGAAEACELAARISAPSRPGYWHAHALLRLAAARHTLGETDRAGEALETACAELDALPDQGMLGVLAETVRRGLSTPPGRDGPRGEPLSEAELRVLSRLAAGRSVSEVARELYLAPTTVKTHRRAIYRKLGVTDRQAAVTRARELGLT